MTERCELCGRAYAVGAVTPAWWPYNDVCDRRTCRTARDDALNAVVEAREKYQAIVNRVAREKELPCAAIGYRIDAFAKMDRDGEDWWALNAVKRVDKP